MLTIIFDAYNTLLAFQIYH